MIIDTKTDKLLPCLCGYKPDSYSTGYGSEPWCIWGPNCKKQTNFTHHYISNHVNNLFDYWNNYVRLKSKRQLAALGREFDKRKKAQELEAEQAYHHYELHWINGEGEQLSWSW